MTPYLIEIFCDGDEVRRYAVKSEKAASRQLSTPAWNFAQSEGFKPRGWMGRKVSAKKYADAVASGAYREVTL